MTRFAPDRSIDGRVGPARFAGPLGLRRREAPRPGCVVRVIWGIPEEVQQECLTPIGCVTGSANGSFLRLEIGE